MAINLQNDLAKILKLECERIWEEEKLAFTFHLAGWSVSLLKNKKNRFDLSGILNLFKGRRLNTIHNRKGVRHAS